jgi:hypothetical protein
MYGECCGVLHPCRDPLTDSPRYWAIHLISHIVSLPCRWRGVRVESAWYIMRGPSTCRTRARPQKALICFLKMLKTRQDKVSRVIPALDKKFLQLYTNKSKYSFILSRYLRTFLGSLGRRCWIYLSISFLQNWEDAVYSAIEAGSLSWGYCGKLPPLSNGEAPDNNQ